MFGYASNETPELMPAPIMFAHRLGRAADEDSQGGRRRWLRPDAKSQVSVIYENGKPVGISNVVISTQHAADASHNKIEKFCIDEVIRKVLPARLLSRETEFLINPTGRFVVGGPQGDTGLTGRKIIVDSYGGMGRHGGGAFSGKDPTKVDRSAAYMGRWVAKNVVAAKLAAKCEVQFAYAIGHPDPVSVHIETFGTATVPDAKITRAVNRVFDFQPVGDHRSAEAAPPDLLEDDQLRPLRQERQGPDVGSDEQGRGAPRGALRGLGAWGLGAKRTQALRPSGPQFHKPSFPLRRHYRHFPSQQ